MPNDVWFGVHVAPEGRDFEEMKRICVTAEKGGFDLFTITDHLMNMRKPQGLDNHPLECWSTLAGLAAATKRIKLGPLVSCYGYRRPTVLAKIATTVDIISGGRLIFGIGAGWHEEEFKGFMGRFPPLGERLRGLKETVEICMGMFTNQRTTYHGKLYQVDDVLNSPLPVQRPVPILLGGSGEKVTLRIAAKHADISHFFATDLTILEHKLAVLRKHCQAVERDYDEIRKATGLRVLTGSSEAEAEEKLSTIAKSRGITREEVKKQIGQGFGTPDKLVDAIEETIKRGVGLITLMPSDVDDIELLSRKVLTQF